MRASHDNCLRVVAFLAVLPGLSASAQAPGAAPVDPPLTTGRTSVQAAVGQRGAVLELQRGARLVLPPGLPIGGSRILTFSLSRRRPQPRQVHERFVVIGPSLAFDGAIDASRQPVQLSIRQNRLPPRRGMKLVLAVEQPGLCDEQNRAYPLGTGLCSSWMIVPATHDAVAGVLRAEMRSPGGHRLQFGWIPEDVDATDIP